MALTVTMPQLGESVTEGTIARWLKHPGDAIAKYESIAEVITDKVNAEIPAPADGVMSELIAPEGAVVPVGQPICSIDTGAAASEAAPEPQAQEAAAVAAPVAQSAEAAPVAEPAPVARSAACRADRAGGAAGGRRDRCGPDPGRVHRIASGDSRVRRGCRRQRAGRWVPCDAGGPHARSRARGRPLPDHGHRDRGADLQEGRS